MNHTNGRTNVADSLREIVTRYGSPCYAYDAAGLREQAFRLRDGLPAGVEVYYSLKANATLGISEVFADCGLGADVASAGELLTAAAADFPAERIFVAGPHKSAETIGWLLQHEDAIVSVDSPFELDRVDHAGLKNRLALRLRPDFDSRACVSAGSNSRFGFRAEDLAAVRRRVQTTGLNVIGFHIFAGSQVLSAADVVAHFEDSFRLALWAARELNVPFDFLNLGGGFGIPYGAADPELDLSPICDTLREMQRRVPQVRLALELGRYLVATSGWYLTSVVGRQVHRGRQAVIVDGGTHQRADLCGLNLRTRAAPPLVLTPRHGGTIETDVLGCLSLPADVLSESCGLPDLAPGDLLAYANAGAYGLWASATSFHGYPPPAEAMFDGRHITLLRERQPAAAILAGQRHTTRRSVAGNWQ